MYKQLFKINLNFESYGNFLNKFFSSICPARDLCTVCAQIIKKGFDFWLEGVINREEVYLGIYNMDWTVSLKASFN